jgi:GNAT superfamily N-acetyltransferase
VTAALEIEALTPARWPALEALFRACDCSCACRFWHFEGDKNAWLARCVEEPEKNVAEQRELLERGDPGGRGLVAIRGDDVVGWMKLAPRASLPKLRTRSVYRALDLGSDEGVWSIGCFLIHPAARKTGVARALAEASARFAAAWGARAIEAYPHRSVTPLGEHEAWMGPYALFTSLGFEPVAGDTEPYPVLRRVVGVR